MSARSEAQAASPSGGDGRGEGRGGGRGEGRGGRGEGHGRGRGRSDDGDDAGGADEAHRSPEDQLLLAALLDGMDAALCAFDADGVVTHWNREAERILGWTREEAVGSRGLAGWALRTADADDVEARLLGAMRTRGRQVDEFALLTKSGGRVLVRIQSSGVTGADGRPSGVYCAFSEVHTQIDLERSVALSESLFETASWGVVLVDADLRPAVVNSHAAAAFHSTRTAMLGRPLGELVGQGLEELEGALSHVLAEGTPPAPADVWVTLRSEGRADARTAPVANSGPPVDPEGAGGPEGSEGSEGSGGPGGPGSSGGYSPYFGYSRHSGPSHPSGADSRADSGAVPRCWRCGFLRLSSPLAEAPVPLGVAWMFQDVTEPKQMERQAAQVRFREGQLHRAGRAAAECEDPMEAASVHLDFALAGFADNALLDLVLPDASAPPQATDLPADADSSAGADSPAGRDTSRAPGADPAPAPDPAHAPAGSGGALTAARTPRLARATAAPAAASPGSLPPVEPGFSSGIPLCYPQRHPALQAFERSGSVRCSVYGAVSADGWAAARKWPEGTVHGLCTALRSRGRTLGVVTFLRGASRGAFDRTDAAYAEDVAVRLAAAVDLAHALSGR